MKNHFRKKGKTAASLLLAAVMLLSLFCLFSCGKQKTENTVSKTGIWENAQFLSDTEFGTGTRTVMVEVQAEDQSVTFTVKTDRETLGEALLEHGLIAGEESQYGLYVKVVNGMTADYDIDQSYWAFTKDGEMMQVGVDGAAITDGEHYELVYTK